MKTRLRHNILVALQVLVISAIHTGNTAVAAPNKAEVDYTETKVNAAEAAQQSEVRKSSRRAFEGYVKDSNGEILIGTAVICTETKRAVVSDITGKYSIDVPAEGPFTLTFSYIGMEKKSVRYKGTEKNGNVTLNSSTTLESAVIVGAYGTVQRREDLVGSAFQVNAETLKDKPVDRLENMLQGVVPGMSIEPNTDTATSTRTRYNTRIRGEASLSASNEPLWIIDGVVQYMGSSTGQMPGMSYTISPLSYLNPDDIESITVLKDADQVSIYGANGANGVILVTTKKGRKNTPLQISATVKFGVAQPDFSTMFKMMNAEQYMEVAKEAWTNAGYSISNFPFQDNAENSYSTTSTYWPTQYFGLGNNQFVQVSLRSGSEKMSGSASASFFNQNNTIKGDDQKRATLRLQEDFYLHRNLTLGLSLNGSYNLNNLFNVGASSFLECPPIYSPYMNDGKTYRLYNVIWDETADNGNGAFIKRKFLANELPNREYNDNIQRTIVTKATANLEWKIIEGLKFTSIFGVEYNSGHEDIYYARTTLDGMDGWTPVGKSSKKDLSYLSWTNSNVLRYDGTFNKHKIGIYAGLELNSRHNKYSSISGSGFTNDQIKEIEYAENKSQYDNTNVQNRRTMSYFGRLSYGYDQRYLFSANLRRDGSSIFGEYSRWGTFWSVGASWNIHKEHWYNVEWLKMAKLKASFGKSGNSRIDITTATGTYSYNSSNGYMGASGAAISTVPNPGLAWETTYQTNAGIRLEFPKNISVELEYYHNYTTDLLSKVYVSRAISADRLYANMGEMSNQGVELTIDADVIRRKDFNWNLTFNAAHNTNRITKLYNGRPTSFGETIWMEGYSSNTYMLIRWAGVDPSDGSPLWYDANGNITRTYNYDNRVPGKSADPIMSGGLTNSFSYKNFTLSFQMNYSIGGYSLGSYARNYMRDGYAMTDSTGGNQAVEVYYYRWKAPGQAALFPKVSVKSQNSTSYNDRFLYDKTNFNITNFSLAYNLDEKYAQVMRMKSLRFAFIIDNVYLFTPGMSRTFNSYKTVMNGYPMTRTYSLSISASF